MNKLVYEELERLANKYHDGHFTIFKFTTNYRCMFGTPYNRMDIENAPKGKTADEAATNAILKERKKRK